MRKLIFILFCLACPYVMGQSLLERELVRYSQEFLIFTDGHVRELMEYGRQGRSDTLLNSLNGRMSVSYFNEDSCRIVFSPARNISIDFNVINFEELDTVVCAIVTLCNPWCSSMVYVDHAGAAEDKVMPTTRAITKQRLAACPPTYVTAALTPDRRKIVYENQTWRSLPADEQDYVRPLLESDTTAVAKIYLTHVFERLLSSQDNKNKTKQ